MGKRERRRLRERSAGGCVATPSATTAARQLAPPRLPFLLWGLAELIDQQRATQNAIDSEIDRLVQQGVGWPAIAAVLGVSRQAARQRALRRSLSRPPNSVQ